MSDKTGKQFEGLSAWVVKLFADSDAEIETDVLIETEFGKRQFDVVLRKEVKPFGEIRIGIEARDHSRKSDIGKIDAFASKLGDCAESIDKGIMVNRKGYSKNAMQKAKRNGIQLYRLEDRPKKLLEEVFKIPIIVEETRVATVLLFGHFEVTESTMITKDTMKINGLNFNEFCLKTCFESRVAAATMREVEVPIDTLEIGGKSFRTQSMSAKMVLITRNHFGYVNELPNTVVMKGELGEEPKILIDSQEIFKSLSFRNWPQFLRIAEAPKYLTKIECGSVEPSFQAKVFDQVMRTFRN